MRSTTPQPNALGQVPLRAISLYERQREGGGTPNSAAVLRQSPRRRYRAKRPPPLSSFVSVATCQGGLVVWTQVNVSVSGGGELFCSSSFFPVGRLQMNLHHRFGIHAHVHSCSCAGFRGGVCCCYNSTRPPTVSAPYRALTRTAKG
jgi:hypothetical protein